MRRGAGVALGALVGCGGGGKCGEGDGETVVVAAEDVAGSIHENRYTDDVWFIPSVEGGPAPGAVVERLQYYEGIDNVEAFAWVPAPFGVSVDAYSDAVPRWTNEGVVGRPDYYLGSVGGDIDLDGRQDFVFSWEGSTSTEHTIYLLSAPEEDGTIPVRTLAATESGGGVDMGELTILGDVDGEGADELLVSFNAWNDNHDILLQRPSDEPWTIEAGEDLFPDVIGSEKPGDPCEARHDLNGDGYNDIVGVGGEVYLGGADPADSTRNMYARYDYWSANPSPQRVGDLNGDGRGDVVLGKPDVDEVRDEAGTRVSSGEVRAWFGGVPGVHDESDADLVFTNDAGYLWYGGAWGVADADGSGYADVVIGYGAFTPHDPGDGLAIFRDPGVRGCGTVPFSSAAVRIDQPDQQHHYLGLEVGFISHDGDATLDVYATGWDRAPLYTAHTREKYIYTYRLGGLL